MKISVNVPTMNEGLGIRKFIKNVEPIADEILLIDDSTDKTASIAKKASDKVRVIKGVGEKHFAKIRNKGIRNTKKGWYLLYMDSDEFLSEELIKEIKKLKKETHPADAYLIKRQHTFKYPKGIARLSTRLIKGEPKLSRKGVIKFKNRLHELPVYQKKDLFIKELNSSTKHYPKTTNYNYDSDYFKAHVKHIIETNSMKSTIKTYIKQLIKYLLIFDYHPKYWEGNSRLWFGTLKYLIKIIITSRKIK